ncbi:zf-TFIIB domain-containing protein [Streptomyces sp. NPDC127106]|uniref:zf-TFIIB domain-containing protein n=1 Tax=Streptomyces sp. NPDC127106 TaxID=3345360 RepID=UPI00362F9B3F
MSRIGCPHCEQDWLAPHRVKSTGEAFHMCPECESIWLERQDLRERTDNYLSEFLEMRGITWGEVKKLEPVHPS